LLEHGHLLIGFPIEAPAGSIPSRQITLQAFNNTERLASTQQRCTVCAGSGGTA
jgi:hypothetical protein